MDPRIIRGILISNVSFPKYLEEEIGSKGKDCELILPYVIRSVKQLISGGADFIVLPCNTLHPLLPILREMFDIEFIDLIEEVGKEIKGKVGVLCTRGTRDSGLYEKAMGGEVIYSSDEDQGKISEIILRIIRGTSCEKDREYLKGVIEGMLSRGAERVILGCTDLGNLVEESGEVVDSTEILVRKIKKKITLKLK